MGHPTLSLNLLFAAEVAIGECPGQGINARIRITVVPLFKFLKATL